MQLNRKPLSPNNRKKVTRSSEFARSAVFDKSPTNKPSFFSWLREGIPGRSVDEGYGGGYRVGRRP